MRFIKFFPTFFSLCVNEKEDIKVKWADGFDGIYLFKILMVFITKSDSFLFVPEQKSILKRNEYFKMNCRGFEILVFFLLSLFIFFLNVSAGIMGVSCKESYDVCRFILVENEEKYN